MGFIVGFFSGVLGMIAGWVGLAALVIAIGGPDRDGGLAMGAFFQIGPVGGLVGFVAGVVLFAKLGLVRGATRVADAPDTPSEPAAAMKRSPVSRPFAVVILAVVGALGWWGWFEFIRSPYLSHGFMTVDLQFRFPSDVSLPSDPQDVHIEVSDGGGDAEAYLRDNAWRGHDENRPVILATASVMYKTSGRIVSLSLPGAPKETWRLDLSSNPDPTPGYTSWRASGGLSPIEMNYKLSADR